MRMVDVDALRRAIVRAYLVGFWDAPLTEISQDEIRATEVKFDDYPELVAILKDLLTVQSL